MKTWRIWLVIAVIFVLIFAHGWDIITQTEQWPFSYYPMYGWRESRR